MRLPASACVVGALILWVAAAGLLSVETFTGSTQAGRWGLFLSVGAATSTVCLALQRCRRVVLEVMSWEHWMQARERDRDDEGRGNVRAIR